MSVVESAALDEGVRNVARGPSARTRIHHLDHPGTFDLALCETGVYVAPANLAHEVAPGKPARVQKERRKLLRIAKRGCGRPHSLLPYQEREIRAWHAAKKALGTCNEKARAMGISRSLFMHIITGRDWI